MVGILKVMVIVIMLVLLVFCSMFLGFELGKSSIHRKIDMAMHDEYEKAITKVHMNVHTLDYIRGIEDADSAVVRTLHGWTEQEEATCKHR